MIVDERGFGSTAWARFLPCLDVPCFQLEAVLSPDSPGSIKVLNYHVGYGSLSSHWVPS